MTRNGKIARLPREIREQLNRRLHEGQQGKHLVKWLNSLTEVQAVLDAEFDRRPVNAQNLSEWKAGGYRDWVLQQETIELVRHMDADSDELSHASKTRLTDLLAQRLAARYVVAAKALNQSDAEGEPDLKSLRELCGDIVALRKGDHSAERLQLERKRLEFEKEQDTRDLKRMFWKWAHHPEVREEVCRGFMTWAEKHELLSRVIFAGFEEPEASVEVKLPDCPCDSESAAPTESNPIKPDQTK